jgi:hypothetical protein
VAQSASLGGGSANDARQVSGPDEPPVALVGGCCGTTRRTSPRSAPGSEATVAEVGIGLTARGVPVKWVEDRSEHLRSTAFARDYHRVPLPASRTHAQPGVAA